MPRMLRYTLLAPRRGIHRRGDTVTVVEGVPFDLEHRKDPAWGRTVMHAHARQEGPVPDQRAQVAYRTLMAFMVEQAARVSALDADQRKAYRALLHATGREYSESFEAVFYSLPDDDDDDDQGEDDLGGDGLPPDPEVPHPVTELQLAGEAGEAGRLQHELQLWEAAEGADGRDEAMASIASLLEGFEARKPSEPEAREPSESEAPLEVDAGGELDTDTDTDGQHLAGLMSVLEGVAEARDTTTTIDALVAKAREHGITIPDTLPRKRVDVANRLLDLATEPPPSAPSADDLGDD